jgi:hypothetical protein
MSGARWSDIMSDDITPPFPYRIVNISGDVIGSSMSKQQAIDYLNFCDREQLTDRKVIDNNDQPFER